ncbi:MAG: hypothetical protein ABH842_02610 [Candidatus Micrarchaeota archaeon]
MAKQLSSSCIRQQDKYAERASLQMGKKTWETNKQPVLDLIFSMSFWVPFSKKGTKPLYSGTRDIYFKKEIVGVGIWK